MKKTDKDKKSTELNVYRINEWEMGNVTER